MCKEELAAKHLQAVGIIPVIKINNPETAVPMARALFRGGLPAAEITFRTQAAAESIARIAREVPEVFVCAGTVLSEEQAEKAANAGAKALISPGLNPKVVKKAQDLGLPIYPGCATATEVEAAMDLGLTRLKLFPAQVVGGTAMLKALYGPYSGISFMPTGGISLKNAEDYLLLPNVIACGGSWICPEELLEKGDFDSIEALARQTAELVRTVRAQR